MGRHLPREPFASLLRKRTAPLLIRKKINKIYIQKY